MKRPKVTRTAIAIAFAALLATPLSAQPLGGQEDLDRAVDIKLFGSSDGNLGDVIALCETAIEKGLNSENNLFAKRVLSATLYQYGELLARPILEDRSLDQRATFLARQALPMLRRSLEIDDQRGDAFYLIASLEALPGGDRDQARHAVEKAIELADGNEQLARALVLQGELAEDRQQELAKYNEALKVQPHSREALRHRGLYYLASGEYAQAVADFELLQQDDSSNLDAYHGLIEALTNLEHFEAAEQQLDRALQVDPSDPLNFILRARLFAMEGKASEAIDVLGEALRSEPRDISALLMRAQLLLSVDQPEAARQDLNRVLSFQLAPVQAMLAPRRVADKGANTPVAVSDLQSPIRNPEKNTVSKLQLATNYAAEKRPWKAIVIFTEILREEPENVAALRGRADMRLGVGQTLAALNDYEEALRVDPNNSTVLNNLAWVLATSSDADVRDARRSIELSQRACQLTNYQQAGTLSTLAAGYAEAGDFETAMQWVRDARQLNQDLETGERLRKELESYRNKTPWREPQQIEVEPKSTSLDARSRSGKLK